MEFTNSTTRSAAALSTTPLFQDDERIRLLFAHVKSMVNDCFHSLYDVVCTQFVEPREQRERFVKGLQFVCDEMRQNHNYSEITRAVTSFPTIDKNYKKAMHRFIEHTLGPRCNARIECRTFEAFLFELYRRVAASVEMRTCRYFTMTYSEQEVFLKDVLRMTMSACVTVIDNANANANANASTLRPDDSVSNIFHFAGGNRAPPTPEEVQRSFERTRTPSIAAAAASVATKTTTTKRSSSSSSRLLIVDEDEDEDDGDEDKKDTNGDGGAASSSLSTLIRQSQRSHQQRSHPRSQPPTTPTHAYATRRSVVKDTSDDDDDDQTSPPPPPPPPSTAAPSRRRRSGSGSGTKEFEIGVYPPDDDGNAPRHHSSSSSSSSCKRSTAASRRSKNTSSSFSQDRSRIPLNLETDLSVVLSRTPAEAAASELVFLH